jgi:hypothetical protein
LRNANSVQRPSTVHDTKAFWGIIHHRLNCAQLMPMLLPKAHQTAKRHLTREALSTAAEAHS